MATRYQNALSILGTQNLHEIIPARNGRVKIYEKSNVDEGEKRTALQNLKVDVVQDLLYLKFGDYVVCKYDDKVSVAFISSYDEEFDDFKVKFLDPSGHNKYYCYLEVEDFAISTKKYLENIGCSILRIRNSKKPILL